MTALIIIAAYLVVGVVRGLIGRCRAFDDYCFSRSDESAAAMFVTIVGTWPLALAFDALRGLVALGGWLRKRPARRVAS